MVWLEQDGPVVRAPQRRGFGHSVTTRLVETGLEGVVEVDYAAEGLRWTLDAPATKLAVDIDPAVVDHNALEDA
jgi:two-component sensor histidine kinase